MSQRKGRAYTTATSGGDFTPGQKSAAAQKNFGIALLDGLKKAFSARLAPEAIQELAQRMVLANPNLLTNPKLLANPDSLANSN